MTGFHAHVFFDDDPVVGRAVAGGLRAATGIELTAWLDRAGGPLPVASWQVDVDGSRLGEVVGWLMLHRQGLPVLIHPETGDDLLDHTEHAAWLGPPLALRLERL